LVGGQGGGFFPIVMAAERFHRASRICGILACVLLEGACSSITYNEPVNLPLTVSHSQAASQLATDVDNSYDDTVVALSFSGGGTRAAAFSYGVLQSFDNV